GTAAHEATVQNLHECFCRELRERGFDIWRSTLALELLHPELSGFMHTWTAGELVLRETQRQGITTSPDYLNSPARVVDETDRTFRKRLTEVPQAMPLLEELRAQGATDYVMLPLPFLDRTRTPATSFATTAPDGFSDQDLEELETAANLFSPYAERQGLGRT